MHRASGFRPLSRLGSCPLAVPEMGELHERGGQRQGRPRGDAGRAPRLALVEGRHARPGAHVGGAVVHAGGHAVQGRAAWKESKGSWSQ